MVLKKIKAKHQVKIMIRAANWVGDAIMTTPVIRAVRINFPKAKITVLAKPWVIPVYENNPYIDEVLVYESNGRHKKGIGTLKLEKDLRAYKFDLAILMQNAFEAGLIAYLGAMKERLGYNTDGRGLLLNRSIKLDPALKKGHLIDYYIGILKGASLIDDGRNLDLYLSASDRRCAKDFLEKQKFDLSKPVIGINPGATGGTAKRWFPERYAKVCEKLAQASGFMGPEGQTTSMGQRPASNPSHRLLRFSGPIQCGLSLL
jgi:heptosyltransferase-2